MLSQHFTDCKKQSFFLCYYSVEPCSEGVRLCFEDIRSYSSPINAPNRSNIWSNQTVLFRWRTSFIWFVEAVEMKLKSMLLKSLFSAVSSKNWNAISSCKPRYRNDNGASFLFVEVWSGRVLGFRCVRQWPPSGAQCQEGIIQSSQSLSSFPYSSHWLWFQNFHPTGFLIFRGKMGIS